MELIFRNISKISRHALGSQTNRKKHVDSKVQQIKMKTWQLYSLINKNSKINLKHKILIYSDNKAYLDLWHAAIRN